VPGRGPQAPASDAEASAEPLQTSSSLHYFEYEPAGGKRVFIGTWSPDRSELPDDVGAQFAGRLPQSTENGL
jgi:hypothetical protein